MVLTDASARRQPVGERTGISPRHRVDPSAIHVGEPPPGPFEDGTTAVPARERQNAAEKGKR
jgi:hypothetical protein